MRTKKVQDLKQGDVVRIRDMDLILSADAVTERVFTYIRFENDPGGFAYRQMCPDQELEVV